MTNKWIEFVKSEAKKNNLSYACALTNKDITSKYEKVKKKTKDEKELLKEKVIINQTIRTIKEKIKNMKDMDGPIIRMKFDSYSPKIKEEFKIKYPKYFEKLFG